MDRIKLIFAFLLSFVFVTSCQKADDNGNLGGFWKLLEIEYVADGSIKDLRQKSYFMSLHLDLMELRGNGSHYARFQHSGDSLFIQMIGGDADTKLLDSFGLNGQEQRFFVQKLNDKSLIIKSVYSKLQFKKF